MMKNDRLTHIEDLIARNQSSYEIGNALNEIRDKGLYKLTLVETFEAYTKASWDMGRAQVYRLIQYIIL